ncbi:MAG TPA: 1-deoxy-D-xylulose-5-phosphate reductoisomerase [Geopsychrobacteraceae bacterium]|nr:1-deoxy-D-xylulose-5-phosphate reductoisomerase [Geopsychrobacteraceae bacterium]
MKQLAVLGSTGSIGVNTLQIVEAFPDKFQVLALTAGGNTGLLLEQIHRFQPQVVAVVAESDADQLRSVLGAGGPEVFYGVEGLVRCASHPQVSTVVAAIVGAAGLVPTMAAIKAGKDIALANKETLVMAGSLVMDAVREHQVKLLPVDSEHSAIFQSLEGHQTQDIRRLILTASGGPFRDWPLDRMSGILPADALAHPNWNMGRKISIDSATMMNKGLEVIEAHWLFNLPVDRIAVHVHPESIVHSMVEYCDGAVLAQLGIPDMQTPIAYALSWPDRLPLNLDPLDLCKTGSLTFSEPDSAKFPCLALAYSAAKVAGSAPAVLNAANEVAVEEFLSGRLSFLQIPRLIEQVLEGHDIEELMTIDQVLRADLYGRHAARELIAGGLI